MTSHASPLEVIDERNTSAGRRRWATAALSVLALTAVAACGGGNDGSAGRGSADKADLIWSFWIAGTEDQAAWQKVADQAHTDHAGITVKLQGAHWDSYWSKIGTTLASGKAPCIIGMQSLRMASYASAMLPLDDLMSKYGLKAEDFDKPIMDGLKVDGKQIAIPYDSGPMVIFYNRDMFKAAGVAEPKPGWTMDEFKAAAKKLTAAGKTGLVTTPGDLGVTSWVRTMTGAEPLADGKLNLTDPKFEQGFSAVRRLRPDRQDRPAGAGRQPRLRDPAVHRRQGGDAAERAVVADRHQGQGQVRARNRTDPGRSGRLQDLHRRLGLRHLPVLQDPGRRLPGDHVDDQ